VELWQAWQEGITGEFPIRISDPDGVPPPAAGEGRRSEIQVLMANKAAFVDTQAISERLNSDKILGVTIVNAASSAWWTE
jgi:hypothetical protein